MTNPFSVLTLALATLVMGISQAEACSRCGNPNCLGNGVYVTSPQPLGFNRFGGIDTFNHQINGSVNMPGRNLSRFNGTARPVNRPMYDLYGRVIGYQRGTVWNNSFTGQEHGNTVVVTPNNLGGTNLGGHNYSRVYGSARADADLMNTDQSSIERAIGDFKK